MWVLSSILIVLCAIVVGIALYFLLIKQSPKTKNIILYVLVGLYFVIVLAGMFKFDAFDRIVGLNSTEFGSKAVMVLLNILRGVSSLSLLLITAIPFIKNKTVKNILFLFCAPVTLLNIIFLKANVECVLGVANATMFNYLSIMYALRLFFECVIYIYLFFVIKHKFEVKENPKQFFFNFFACLFPLLLLIVPLHNFQQLFGTVNSIEVEFLTFGQHIWIALTIVFMLLIHNIFRNKSEDVKYSLIVLLSLACFYQFNLYYTTIDIPLHNLPLNMYNHTTILIPI